MKCRINKWKELNEKCINKGVLLHNILHELISFKAIKFKDIKYESRN